MQINNLISYFDTIEKAFKRTKLLTLTFAGITVLVSLGAVFLSYSYVKGISSRVYVIEGGKALSAAADDSADQRELEAEDHLTRFHELLFNLSPSREAIHRNFEKAFLMSDRSAYTYVNDLEEKGFYERMVSANITEQISIDSTRVLINSYPYESAVYAKLYIIRESNITKYDIMTRCRLVDCTRTKNNPHGLMIENFKMVKNEKIETRRRK